MVKIKQFSCPISGSINVIHIVNVRHPRKTLSIPEKDLISVYLGSGISVITDFPWRL